MGKGHLQGSVHMAAIRLGYKRAMVGIRWTNSRPGYMSMLRKRYSHHLGGSFLAGNAFGALSVCLPTENADC